MSTRQPDSTRGTIAFIFIIVVGFGLGALIKHVNIGLIIGLAIGLFSSGLLRKR
jgi:hypothetical protein